MTDPGVHSVNSSTLRILHRGRRRLLRRVACSPHDSRLTARKTAKPGARTDPRARLSAEGEGGEGGAKQGTSWLATVPEKGVRSEKCRPHVRPPSPGWWAVEPRAPVGQGARLGRVERGGRRSSAP